VIDDDPSIREALSMLLESEGYFVDTAQDGKEAIEKTDKYFYNLAIIDYRLPDIEGTVLLTKLKQTTPKMIKVMLTGFPSTKNAIDAVNNNANAFIEKPVDSETLVNKIEQLLRKQEEEAKYSDIKVAEFLQTKVMEIKSNLIVKSR
jgi:DNA-binding NtrC family response regulator